MTHSHLLIVGLVDDPVDLGAGKARNGYDASDSDSRICGDTDGGVALQNGPFGVTERDARNSGAVCDTRRQLSELPIMFVVHGTSLQGTIPRPPGEPARVAIHVELPDGQFTMHPFLVTRIGSAQLPILSTSTHEPRGGL